MKKILKSTLLISASFALIGCNPNDYAYDPSAVQAQANSGKNSDSNEYHPDDELPINNRCKPRKILICHIPSGNPANAHTLCVSEAGALHGHKIQNGVPGGHGGDYAGPCGAAPEPSPSPEPTGQPEPTPPVNPTPTPPIGPTPTPPVGVEPTPTPPGGGPSPTPPSGDPTPTPTPPGDDEPFFDPTPTPAPPQEP